MKTKEERAEYRKAYIQTVEGRANKLWLDARRRAKTKGLVFTISKAWVIEALEHGMCPRTTETFYTGEPRTKGVNEPNAPSLDRIVPELGYTQENTQVVIWAYNCAKSTWSDEALLKLSHHICNTVAAKRMLAL
jgi:hypothetical protein